MHGYKVDVPVVVRFRCHGDPTTVNPTLSVLDETDAVVQTLTIGSGLSQVGSSRVVKGTFTPDALGQWSVQATDDNGLDLVKQYSVGTYSTQSVGAMVATLEAKLDLLAEAQSIGGGHFG